MRHLQLVMLIAFACVSISARAEESDAPVIKEPVFEEEEVDEPVVMDPIAPDVQFSETFWQPGLHGKAVEITGSYDRSVNDVKNAAGTNVGTENLKSTMAQASFGYGVSTRTAIRVSANYLTRSQDVSLNAATPYTLNNSGLGTIGADVLHTVPLGLMSVHFLAGADLSPGKQKEPTAGSEGNAYPGGHTLRGAIGFDVRVNRGYFGGFGGLQHKLRRDLETTNGAELNVTGGNEVVLMGFYEHHWGRFYLLPSVRITPKANETTSSPTGTSEAGSYVPTIYSLLAGYYPTDNLRLSAGYERVFVPGHTTGLNSAADSYSANRILASGRFTF